MSSLELAAPVRAGGRMRRKNTLLKCLEMCRDLHPNFGLPDVIAFLYVCENEGLTMAELAYVSQHAVATASRRVRSLGPEGQPGSLEPYLGLVDFTPNPDDERGRLMRLTAEGRALRDRLDQVIGDAVAIAQA